MKLKTFQLKFRTAVVPQLRRLPAGVRLVEQLPCADSHGVGGKYAAFTKGGHLITLYAGNSKRVARKRALGELNTLLLNVNLIMGQEATMRQYRQAIPA